MGRKRIPLEDQYMPEPNSGCWLWIGPNDGIYGYGKVNRKAHGERQAYRAVYIKHKGPIPDGLCRDHLCRNPACVNPDHLEPVTMRENIMRGRFRDGLKLGGTLGSIRRKERTHCRKGHEWTVENTKSQKDGARVCRTCRNARARVDQKARYYAAKGENL